MGRFSELLDQKRLVKQIDELPRFDALELCPPELPGEHAEDTGARDLLEQQDPGECFTENYEHSVDYEWYETLFRFVFVKKAPDKSAKSWGGLVKGQKFQVKVGRVRDQELDLWVELTPFELWRSCKCKSHDDRGYAMIDGSSRGLGQLLRGPLPPHQCPGPDLAEESGLSWRLFHGISPPSVAFQEDSYICRWQAHGSDHAIPGSAHNSIAPLISQGKVPPKLPKLCIGTLLRGAPPQCVFSWIVYHHRIGFERLILFFDDPRDPALVVASPFIQKCDSEDRSSPHVVVHLLTGDWWESARQRSRFYKAAARDEPWACAVVKAHEEAQDVAARQQLCLDLASQDAQHDGYDWLLHIDIDELFYLPDPAFREDAPAWFFKVQPSAEMVRFHNHECVPETWEVGDWFQDVTLFKVNPEFLKPREELTGEWRDTSPPPGEYHGDAHDQEETTVAATTKRMPKAKAAGCNLAIENRKSNLQNKDQSSEIARLKSQLAEAQAALQRSQVEQEAGADRWESQEEGDLTAEKKGSRQSNAGGTHSKAGADHEDAEDTDNPFCLKQEAPDKRLCTFAYKKMVGHIRDFRMEPTRELWLALPDAQEFKRRQREAERNPRVFAPGPRSRALQKTAPKKVLEETFTHFLGYSDGKAAARLCLGGKPPVPRFVTRFRGADGIKPLTRRRADGDADPVVLHYANCGFSYWLKKYTMLGDFPDAVNGQLVEMRAHLASRDLVQRNSQEDLEAFYRLFIMGNQFGELPAMVSRGLAVRVYGAQEIIYAARFAARRQLEATGLALEEAEPVKEVGPASDHGTYDDLTWDEARR